MLPSVAILNEAEKKDFEEIISEVRNFFKKNEVNSDPIFIKIKICPNEKVAFALERYFLDVATWKNFRLFLEENSSSVVLSASSSSSL